MRLNNFLIEVTNEILKIKNKSNGSEPPEEIVFEAEKRPYVIVALLDIYEKYLKSPNDYILIVSPLDDYISFRYYYNLIGTATATLFFVFFLRAAQD